jgi:hypothetical protein
MYYIFCYNNLQEILVDSAEDVKELINALETLHGWTLQDFRLMETTRFFGSAKKITEKFIIKEYSSKQLQEFMCKS